MQLTQHSSARNLSIVAHALACLPNVGAFGPSVPQPPNLTYLKKLRCTITCIFSVLEFCHFLKRGRLWWVGGLGVRWTWRWGHKNGAWVARRCVPHARIFCSGRGSPAQLRHQLTTISALFWRSTRLRGGVTLLANSIYNSTLILARAAGIVWWRRSRWRMWGRYIQGVPVVKNARICN